MFRKKVLGVLICCIVLSIATEVSAWDGQRRGFILGFGLGPGLTSLTIESGGETSDRENRSGLQTDFKIGGAPSNQLQIYYTNKVSWYKEDEVLYGEDVTFTCGLSAVGVSYYLLPESPSAFFSGCIGISSWDAPFEEDLDINWTGFGFFVGAGFEFSRYWNAEFDFVWGEPSEGGVSINALSLMLTINVIGY
ncbi:MAG: hypothetical protein JSU92_07220 [Deltaproteobacteria bacterium]|nr:MAG: hypothetical protein JSU92_07220 [Deltaproteobacteria bacterium]